MSDIFQKSKHQETCRHIQMQTILQVYIGAVGWMAYMSYAVYIILKVYHLSSVHSVTPSRKPINQL